MKNTDFSISALDFIISSDDSLNSLVEMIEEMDLEITDITLV